MTGRDNPVRSDEAESDRKRIERALMEVRGERGKLCRGMFKLCHDRWARGEEDGLEPSEVARLLKRNPHEESPIRHAAARLRSKLSACSASPDANTTFTLSESPYDVMSQLRPHIQRADYLGLIRLQEREVGFCLASLRDAGLIICVAGFRFCRSLGWGKFLYIDDLITDQAHRSRGAGKAMFQWLVEYARKANCDEVRLDSALWRNEAQRFYLRERMDIACFNFRLALTARQGVHQPN